MIRHTHLLFLLYQVTVIVSQLTEEQKCRVTDSTCLVKTAQQLLPCFTSGISELGIQTLDTMEVDNIIFDIKGFQLNLTDVKIKGFNKSIIKDINFDMNEKILELTFLSDLLSKSKYVASGKVAQILVNGDGNFTLKLTNIKQTYRCPFEIKKDQNGEDVLELKSIKYEFDYQGLSNIKLTNLFGGNKFLSDFFHHFINTHWTQITEDLGPGFLEKPSNYIFEAIKVYLKSQPLKQLFLN